jgi:hypothetical protein
MQKPIIFVVCCFFAHYLKAQTLGGNSVFSFLQLPQTTQQAALGGVNISNLTTDVGLISANPALLQEKMHQQVHASFNSFFAGINNYGLSTAYYLPKKEITLGAAIQYINYGNITQTDAIGNILGNFSPTDYAVSVMASKILYQRFSVGTTAKFINSNYGQYRSNGAAIDIGINYIDTANLLQIAFVVKNMGTQLKTYDGSSNKQELPFDMQIGITKRLAKAPLQFSFTAHQLQRLNSFYNDTAFNNSEGLSNNEVSFANKILQHCVVAAQAFLSNKIELTLGYNFLRRTNLNIANSANGVNGFTMGLGLYLKKVHLRYATGFYQRHQFHQVGINFNWKGNME